MNDHINHVMINNTVKLNREDKFVIKEFNSNEWSKQVCCIIISF